MQGWARLSVVTMLAWPLIAVGQDAEAERMDKPSGNILAALPHNPKECAPTGVANGGYDVVSYRDVGGPRFGSAEYAVEHGGLTYVFETETNRDLFLADPEYYLPAYGGWCAVTLSLGRLSCPEYTNFKIENDRVLLFEQTGFTNGQTVWNSDPERFRGLADDNYAIVLDFE